MEIWTSIKGYESEYFISNYGNVLSLPKKRWNPYANKYSVNKAKMLKPSTNSLGYKKVVLCKGGKKKTHLVHRLVAMHFVDNKYNHNIVGHLDHSTDNNNYENLVWCTQSQNIQHSANAGRIKGNKYGKSYRNRDEIGRFV